MERKIDRLDKYLKFKGLNDNKISVQLGLSVGILGKSRKPGKDLSAKTIERILRNFNDLNPTWLLTGEGEMLTITKPQQPTEDITISREVFDLIYSQQKTIFMQQETILILQKDPGGE